MKSSSVAAPGRRVSFLLAVVLIAAALAWSQPSTAEAFSVDASAATFNFDYSSGGNGTLLSGVNAKDDGAVVLFSTVTTIDGVEIDAVVTTDTNGATIDNYDEIGGASTNEAYFQINNTSTAAGGYTAFTFDFYEHGTYSGPGTGAPVTLRNVTITSIDIDSPGQQFQDFVGYQTYVLNSPSRLTAVDRGAGVTRFEQSSPTNGDNIPGDAVQVTFDAVTSFTAKFGNEQSNKVAYFGLAFKSLGAVFGVPPASPAAPINNPSNRPPTSTDTTRYVVNGTPSTIQLADFGNFQDLDANPFVQVRVTTLPAAGTLQRFVAGTWQAVAAGDDIAVADIQNGNVRYTGFVDDTLTFKVNDGLANSDAPYTMSLLVSDQPQAITFANPGTKLPTDPAFASGATASSGLPVTLTSSTPGVCTVSGLDITPVSEGQCTVVATQAGNRSFGAADPVTQTFPISTKTPQTITAPSPGNQAYTGGPTTVVVSPTASSGLAVSLLSLTPDVCTVSGYTITIVGQGNCAMRNTQAGNGTYAAAPQVQYTFQVVSYTLAYDANGADSGSVPSSQSGVGDVTVSGNTGSLVRDGFTFGGWDIGGSTFAGGATYTLAANVTAHAIWTAVPVVPASYTLTYDGNGAGSGSVPASQTGSGDVTISGNTGSLVRDGFTFGGWDIGGSTFAGGATYTLAANVTAHAIWTGVPVVPASYTLTYDGNGAGSGSVPSSQSGVGDVTVSGNTGSLARDGFTFGGWDLGGSTFAGGATYTLAADVTARAIWNAVPVVHTLTFVAGGAEGGSVPLTISESGLVTLPANSGSLVRDGYTLAGWTINGVDYPISATLNLSFDAIAYPIWQKIASTDTTPTSGTGGLAATGSSVRTTLALSLGLFGGGAALFLLGRSGRLRRTLG